VFLSRRNRLKADQPRNLSWSSPLRSQTFKKKTQLAFGAKLNMKMEDNLNAQREIQS